ncbi:MAG: 4Fe-4S dicluster domain-containing protein [Betaproteobacteria bacterium]
MFSISMRSYMALELQIDTRYCKECGICVAFCPRQILVQKSGGKVSIENPEKCIDCQLCDILCPEFAITIVPADEAVQNA